GLVVISIRTELGPPKCARLYLVVLGGDRGQTGKPYQDDSSEPARSSHAVGRMRDDTNRTIMRLRKALSWHLARALEDCRSSRCAITQSSMISSRRSRRSRRVSVRER